MIKKICPFLIIVGLVSSPVYALDIPSSSKYDQRVKHVNYNHDDVVQLDAMLGVATVVELEPGEQFVTHFFGTSGAWELASEANYIAIKPTKPDIDTNLTVITDKRSYLFRVTYHERGNGAVYKLTFAYPAQEKAKAAKAARLAAQARNDKRMSDIVQDRLSQRDGNVVNLDYMMSGDKGIAPMNVWDDGQFTYFKFATNTRAPAVYSVDDTGQEHMINRHNEPGEGGNIVVAESVSQRWNIRLGDEQVLGIVNQGYDAAGVDNDSGTTSRYVEKRIKVQGGH